jgi:tRNA nucleotidyltransferase/poly(A) polymerase
VRSLGKAASLIAWTLVLCGACLCVARAQNAAIDELKGKIFDAHMAQQTFPGLKYCNELTGKSFYFQMRNRVLRLEEYFQSLENLVKAQVYNPAKRRSWTLEDAKERWEEVKKQAEEDKQKCELVRSLPDLEKKLQDLEKSAAASEKQE